MFGRTIHPGPSFQAQPQQSFQPAPGHDNMEKDMEVLSSKIDALRSQIELLTHKINNIERLAVERSPRQEDKDVLKW